MTYFGEGSTANGQWHEAMNFAGVQRLPVVFVLENNGFAYSTPNELEFAVDPVERAATYGFPGVLVDGNDVEAVFEAVAGRRRARPRGRRPDADRVPDDAHARPRRPRRHELRAAGDARGVGRARPDRALRASGWSPSTASTADEVERIRAEVKAYVDECAADGARLADARPGRGDRRASSPTTSTPLGDGQAPWSHWADEAAEASGSLMAEMTYLEAISDGLRDGDAPRRVRVLPRRGHRRLRRRVQGHRRLHRGVRRRPGARHAAGRERDHRRRGRRRGRGAAAGLRDAVRRLHLLRLRPARQRRRQAPLPPGRRRADGRPAARRAAASPAGRSTRRTRRPGSCRRPG